ncbi:hypothetical protein NEMBOFW57_004625 [Staphylotrichum longicolle]|uniref:Uncharacterized protein n=1 Tax=Staphylotrichum longicolle TaxID=669026 RepID=A0AAD4F804_9PEZI|nr:hypothetical protein NEMBOFW57_004625 [Staphylotrichum longicolle]
MATVTIRSAHFPNCYLRLDGTAVTRGFDDGAGTVNIQGYAGPWETFRIEKPAGEADDVVVIGSTAFPNVYLRVDASTVHGFSDPGSGGVNAQFGHGPYERFRFIPQSDGTTAIESVQWPGVYLRMDGAAPVPVPTPFGIVNCQASIGLYEKFIISEVSHSLTRADLEQAISTYAPVLQLHPNEAYVNTSIEYFLQHSTLVDSKSGNRIVHPAIDQLPQAGDDKQFYLELEDGAKGGDFSSAKAYVHAYWVQGMSYTDLQFWLFSAYNGPGTAHINGLVFDTIVHTGDVNLAPLGEHFGDWECVVVRIDNDTKEMTNIWLSQHSGGQWFDQEQISSSFRMAQGTHPIVYSSRNGHANYPSADSNYTEHYKVPPVGIPAGIEFFLRNDTANGGLSLDCSQNYQIVSADWLKGADAYPVPAWVTYPFRWGPEGTATHISANTVKQIIQAAAGPLAPFLPGSLLLLLAAEILPFFVKDDVNGPGAPITKSTWNGGY